MPIYGYRCSKGHEYERAEGFDAPTEQKCPTCGSDSQRQISLPAVVFKGRGFYSTDNRKGAAGDNGASRSSGSGDGQSSDGGSESLGSGDGQSSDGGSESKTEAAKAD